MERDLIGEKCPLNMQNIEIFIQKNFMKQEDESNECFRPLIIWFFLYLSVSFYLFCCITFISFLKLKKNIMHVVQTAIVSAIGSAINTAWTLLSINCGRI